MLEIELIYFLILSLLSCFFFMSEIGIYLISLFYFQNELDKICEQLSPDHWFNPHKSWLGTGNYDINVVIAALETKGCAIVWFDKRKYV